MQSAFEDLAKYHNQLKMAQSRCRRLINVVLKNASIPVQLLLLLWPFVPVAITLAFTKKDEHRLIFALSYIAIVPCASTLDLTGQELAHLLPRIAGIAVETILGTVVEMVLFIILIARSNTHGNAITVIKAAILGSILANTLLCLGLCLLIGGLRYHEQKFHSLVGGTSSDVLLGSGFAMLLPAMFFYAFYSSATSNQSTYPLEKLANDTLTLSRAIAVILLSTFFVHIHHNTKAKRTVLDQILESEKEVEPKDKLTMMECLLLSALSLGCVCILAYILVREIHPIVQSGPITENFMGLIIVPLVEKVAEHITAVNKVLKNQSNMAILHCIVPSISTVLFNTPLVVFVGWGLGKPMDLNFEAFQVASLLLVILLVIHFLEDGTSNFLKGYILIVIYIALAIAAWFSPSITVASQNEGSG